MLWETTAQGQRCGLCPHKCVLRPGSLGACRVRRGGVVGMETATYATSVLHQDAVERKPFYHYRPGTIAVSLAAPGCSFRCDYCVNFRISQFGRDGAAVWTAKEVDPWAVVERARKLNGCVALSYTEPSLAIELTHDLARVGRAVGVEVIWKTNGFLTPAAVESAAQALAAVNIDVKTVNRRAHRRLTGGDVRPVLDAIEGFRDRDVWVEVSTPMIPGLFDAREIAEAIAEIDPAIPWHLLRYTPAYRMNQLAPTAPQEIADAVAVGRAVGLKYVYVERALGAEGRSTCCPRCRGLLIERGVWSTRENRLDSGRCPYCGCEIEGRW